MAVKMNIETVAALSQDEQEEALKAELRREIRAKIEQLDALYDVETDKYFEIDNRIRHAQDIGAGNDEATNLMVNERVLSLKKRRNLRYKAAWKRQELHDVDGPTLEEEYAAAHKERRAWHSELSDKIISAHQALAILTTDGNLQTEEATALRESVLALQEKRTKIESELENFFKEIDAEWMDAEQRTMLTGEKPEKGLIPQALVKATKPKKKIKALPATSFKNQQIDLFRDLLANTDQERSVLSNAIDLWDSVPRYSITRARQAEMRVDGGFLPIANLEFQHKGKSYTAQIRPARIEKKDKNGHLTTLEIYPSVREELIEHVLRKFATEHQAGFFDGGNDFRSGVTFTLHHLRAELDSLGHSMRYDELMESLDVMNLSNIRLIDKSLNDEDPSFISQPYLPALAKVSKAGRAADPDAKWFVQFHGALTVSMDQLTYRQFNYRRLMNCQSQLSRWLISQLVLKYTFAAPGNTFKMLHSTIKRDSRLLDNYSRPRAAVDALDTAFEELKREGVLMSVQKVAKTGVRGKIEDVEYTLAASVKFSAEQKAANKRKSTRLATLGACG